jgi:hypothetical protein
VYLPDLYRYTSVKYSPSNQKKSAKKYGITTSLILALPKKEGDNRVLPPLPPLQVPVLVI